jgi:hydrogenase nickel incorporation protein HypA/HybF
MHELQIAHDLAVIVVEAANRERLNRVTSVNLQFGEMIQIVPDIFKFAFDEATKGTLAQDAEIILEIIPIRIRCGNCQKEADIENLTFR